ncbi:MAG: RDD family protein [Proteobacteria bacterium]|nr:RDD family protein [Pseudomonadota bacterium]
MSALPDAGLLVDSDTGIDVALPVAGPGARAYAFVIDWHARLILGAAWYVICALLYNGELSLHAPPKPSASWFVVVVMPALALYFLYHPVLEVLMHGSTPGKRAAGVRIVTRSGAAPGVGALLVRNVFRLIDSLPVFYGLGLIVAAVSRDHLRWGDMAAGTLLVYRQGVVAPPLVRRAAGAAALDTHTAELVFELLRRWDSLESTARATLARRLLVRAGLEPVQADASGEDDLRVQLEKLANRA